MSCFWEKEKVTLCAAQRFTINNLDIRKGESIADEKGEMNPKTVERKGCMLDSLAIISGVNRGVRTSYERQRQDFKKKTGHCI